MTENLFVDLPTFQFNKVADVRLPADTTQWEHAIFNALSDQHPNLPTDQFRLSLNSQDEGTRSAIGNIVIRDGLQIPVIVDQGKLKPFDMFLNDGKLYSMDADTLAEAVQNTGFGEIMPPGQGEIMDVFLTHSRPPYDGKYTFAAYLGGKNEYLEALTRVMGEKTASFVEQDTAVLGMLKDAGTKTYDLQVKTKTASIVKQAAVPIQNEIYRPIVSSGCYKVASYDGKRYRGWFIQRPYDPGFDGPSNMFVPFSKHAYALKLGTNESLRDIGGIEEESMGRLPDDDTRGHGAFCWINKQGELRSTVPMTILGQSVSGHYAKTASVLSQSIRVEKDDDLDEPITLGGVMYVPKHANWMHINDNEIDLKEAATQPLFDRPFMTIFRTSDDRYRVDMPSNVKQACFDDMPESMNKKQASDFLSNLYEHESVSTVLSTIQARGSVMLRAPLVSKTAGLDSTKLATVCAKFVPRMKKHAEEALKAFISMRYLPDLTLLKRVGTVLPLAKVAADDLMQDDVDEGLDATLGLNILTEENIMKYLDYVDLLDSARQAALKLLLAARLGLPVDEGAARSAAFSLDALISDLRQLRTIQTPAGNM